MRTFLNTPWRVERSPGELLVVDCKNMVVASFDVSDPDELPGEVSDEEAKAFLLAAAPGIFGALTSFLEVMADPAKCVDEDLVMQQLELLQLNMQFAEVPRVEAKEEKPNAGAPLR